MTVSITKETNTFHWGLTKYGPLPPQSHMRRQPWQTKLRNCESSRGTSIEIQIPQGKFHIYSPLLQFKIIHIFFIWYDPYLLMSGCYFIVTLGGGGGGGCCPIYISLLMCVSSSSSTGELLNRMISECYWPCSGSYMTTKTLCGSANFLQIAHFCLYSPGKMLFVSYFRN